MLATPMKVKNARIDVKKLMGIYSFGVGQFQMFLGLGVTVLQQVIFWERDKKVFRNYLRLCTNGNNFLRYGCRH